MGSAAMSHCPTRPSAARESWQHVQAVLHVAQQQRCHRIWLAREREGALEYIDIALPCGVPPAFLKTEEGLVELPVARFPVYVVPKAIETREWETGDAVSRAMQPTAATYLFGLDEQAGGCFDGTGIALWWRGQR